MKKIYFSAILLAPLSCQSMYPMPSSLIDKTEPNESHSIEAQVQDVPVEEHIQGIPVEAQIETQAQDIPAETKSIDTETSFNAERKQINYIPKQSEWLTLNAHYAQQLTLVKVERTFAFHRLSKISLFETLLGRQTSFGIARRKLAAADLARLDQQIKILEKDVKHSWDQYELLSSKVIPLKTDQKER